MCGRFIDPNLRGTEVEHSELKIDPFPRRFNIKPTQDVLVVAKTPLVGMFARWWLVPSWHRGDLKDWKATTFNARIEDAKTKPTFRAVWRHGRCLIPGGGYYEWTGDKGAKQPHLIRSAGNEETLWFAGLASRWQDLLTCTVMTRAANDDVKAVHHRMPVMLNADEREAWLGGSDDVSLGEGARLTHHPVARFGIEDDGPELLEPIDP
ncbi:SOS response-associated peptidase [Paracoccus zeaxanthinifaciens]|uniref:SOS response-associated peptidase n=1 Tax=Paracoccus zeaxanthinifaciens TaxID=187400 RepID=UPI0003B7B86D|nr:SOS response-associated peptidase [Paracoccus zeaxanthinifaciens]